MNISTILDHIDTGHMALPEFQRGYVWSREQMRWLCLVFPRGRGDEWPAVPLRVVCRVRIH